MDNKTSAIEATVRSNKPINESESTYCLGLQASEFRDMEISPGRFVFLESITSARRPISIFDYDSEKGIIYLLIQKRGKNTEYYHSLWPEQKIKVNLSETPDFKFNPDDNGFVLISGGVGVAAMKQVSEHLSKMHQRQTLLAGFPNENEVYLPEYLDFGINYLVSTDEPSDYFYHGSVVKLFESRLMQKKRSFNRNHLWAQKDDESRVQHLPETQVSLLRNR